VTTTVGATVGATVGSALGISGCGVAVGTGVAVAAGCTTTSCVGSALGDGGAAIGSEVGTAVGVVVTVGGFQVSVAPRGRFPDMRGMSNPANADSRMTAMGSAYLESRLPSRDM
jgi:hypothetical protein